MTSVSADKVTSRAHRETFVQIITRHNPVKNHVEPYWFELEYLGFEGKRPTSWIQNYFTWFLLQHVFLA